jgi:hypothetical protein
MTMITALWLIAAAAIPAAMSRKAGEWAARALAARGRAAGGI